MTIYFAVLSSFMSVQHTISFELRITFFFFVVVYKTTFLVSIHYWILCASELLVLFCMFPATSSKYRWIKNRKKKKKEKKRRKNLPLIWLMKFYMFNKPLILKIPLPRSMLFFRYRDSLFVSILNCLTSLFAGFVIFSIVGFMAHESGKEVDDVVTQGEYYIQ